MGKTLMTDTELRAALLETTARGVHQGWVLDKLAAGVTSRLSPAGEELMVDYDDLSDAAQELNRMMVRTVYKALKTIL